METLLKPLFQRLSINVIIKEDEHFSALGYKNEFKQVMVNLFTNAKDVSEERGEPNATIWVSFETGKTTNIIKIKDNAGGIKPELLPHKLFENYVTTKGEKGTGIGLNISKTIIEQKMNGKIWAHNTDGGAEFVIELPKV